LGNQDPKNQAGTPEDILKEYATEDLIVYWKPKLCAHPGFCWKGLPQVFNPRKRPWVDMQAASPEEIINTINTCPTGALTYALPEGSKVDPQKAQGPGWVNYRKGEPAITRIKMLKNGPLMVEGPTEIYDTERKLIKQYHQFALCRCGFSSNKPFCDGAHIRQGWKD
jgi:uncharacterized Fe-S cluster protein YjdI